MALTSATRDAPAAPSRADSARPTAPSSDALRTAETRAEQAARQLRPRPTRHLTDDEILGLSPASAIDADAEAGLRLIPADLSRGADKSLDSSNAPEPVASSEPSAEADALRATLDANPDLRSAWDDAQAFRESFSSPDEARAATALLADLDRMDALFFSRRPEDHAELARAVANLDPAAFASLAQAMAGLAASTAETRAPHPNASPSMLARQSAATPLQNPALTEAQTEFFRETNAAAVQSVIDSIESQVERLLPEGVSKSVRNRVVGEIYRELDNTLSSNRQLARQMRDAFRSGALDPDHQRALVSLVSGRARQALPGVAKRVMNEWTSTIVAANQDRRARQHAAEHRVDIAGSSGAGNDGPRSITPREIDYRRMSDSDILNL